MADPIDHATNLGEKMLQISIHNARHSAPSLPPKGSCYNCYEPLSQGQRFCDSDCRDDYEKRQRMRG